METGAAAAPSSQQRTAEHEKSAAKRPRDEQEGQAAGGPTSGVTALPQHDGNQDSPNKRRTPQQAHRLNEPVTPGAPGQPTQPVVQQPGLPNAESAARAAWQADAAHDSGMDDSVSPLPEQPSPPFSFEADLPSLAGVEVLTMTLDVLAAGDQTVQLHETGVLMMEPASILPVAAFLVEPAGQPSQAIGLADAGFAPPSDQHQEQQPGASADEYVSPDLAQRDLRHTLFGTSDEADTPQTLGVPTSQAQDQSQPLAKTQPLAQTQPQEQPVQLPGTQPVQQPPQQPAATVPVVLPEAPTLDHVSDSLGAAAAPAPSAAHPAAHPAASAAAPTPVATAAPAASTSITAPPTIPAAPIATVAPPTGASAAAPTPTTAIAAAPAQTAPQVPDQVPAASVPAEGGHDAHEAAAVRVERPVQAEVTLQEPSQISPVTGATVVSVAATEAPRTSLFSRVETRVASPPSQPVLPRVEWPPRAPVATRVPSSPGPAVVATRVSPPAAPVATRVSPPPSPGLPRVSPPPAPGELPTTASTVEAELRQATLQVVQLVAGLLDDDDLGEGDGGLDVAAGDLDQPDVSTSPADISTTREAGEGSYLAAPMGFSLKALPPFIPPPRASHSTLSAAETQEGPEADAGGFLPQKRDPRVPHERLGRAAPDAPEAGPAGNGSSTGDAALGQLTVAVHRLKAAQQAAATARLAALVGQSRQMIMQVVDREAAALDTQSHETLDVAHSLTAQLQQQLADKFLSCQNVAVHYQNELVQEWEQYRALYNSMVASKHELQQRLAADLQPAIDQHIRSFHAATERYLEEAGEKLIDIEEKHGVTAIARCLQKVGDKLAEEQVE